MKNVSPILACVLLAAGWLLTAWSGPAQASPAAYKAWIAIVQKGSVYQVEPMCQAPEDAVVTYRLAAHKTGPSGTSTSSQSGKVKLKAGQAKALCRLSLGIKPGDSYEFELEVFKDGTKVAEATAASPRGI